MRYAMIMAGGAGTRLWPMSRRDRPKQLLPLIERPGGGHQSLLDVAAERAASVVPRERVRICTGEVYRATIRAAMGWLDDRQILGEPVARDTVNAVGLTAAVLLKDDPDAVFAVFTADHLIEPAPRFARCVEHGFRLVEADPRRLATFSIRPTSPATGYGYIERGAPIPPAPGLPEGSGEAFRVARYVEKPSLELAQAYVESGAYSWNSGMFVWHASTLLDCIRKFKPECHEGLMRIQDAWGTPRQREVLDAVYPTLPKISVDYAVMEPASTDRQVQVCTVLMDVSWLDVGSWPAYAETLPPDPAGNRVGGAGAAAVVLERSRRSLVVTDDPSHTVALLGCDDLIVVRTPDATLVMPLARAEELKALQSRLPPERT